MEHANIRHNQIKNKRILKLMASYNFECKLKKSSDLLRFLKYSMVIFSDVGNSLCKKTIQSFGNPRNFYNKATPLT